MVEAIIRDELIPIIDGIEKRGLLRFVEKNEFEPSKGRFQIRCSILKEAHELLRRYLDGYLFPKLLATDVQFKKYAFGEVTNRPGEMHLEVVLEWGTNAKS